MNYKNITMKELKVKEKRYNNVNNEGGYGYNPYTDEIDKRGNAEAEEMKKSVDAEWTKKVTIYRRKQWNDKIRSGDLSKGNKVNFIKLRAYTKELGWDMHDLSVAMKRHGIK